MVVSGDVSRTQMDLSTLDGSLEDRDGGIKTQSELLHETGYLIQKLFHSFTSTEQLHSSISSISHRLSDMGDRVSKCESSLERIQSKTVLTLMNMIGEERKKREAMEELVHDLQAELDLLKMTVDMSNPAASVKEDISAKTTFLMESVKLNSSKVHEAAKTTEPSSSTSKKKKNKKRNAKSNSSDERSMNENSGESHTFGSILYLLGTVNGREAHVLLGTAAAVSAMTLQECQRLGLQILEAPSNLFIKPIWGDLRPVHGIVMDVGFHFGEFRAKWSFYVADIDFHPIILGTDFIKERTIVLGGGAIHISNEKGVLLDVPVIQKQMKEITHGVLELVQL